MKTAFLFRNRLTLVFILAGISTWAGFAQISSLRLNEILSSPGSASQGRPVGWVELYNPTSTPLLLDDASLSDNPAQPRRFIFPAGTTIAPGGFLAVSCARSNDCAGLCTGWTLRRHGGVVYFFDKPANGTVLVDSVQYGIQAADFSLGRFPDGTGDWVLTWPTVGATNRRASLGSPMVLKINEWMAANLSCVMDPDDGEYDDWFELYNPGDLPVELSGLGLTDNLARPNKFVIPARSFIGIGRGAYSLFFADSGSYLNHVNFRLSSQGDIIALFSQDGVTLIDWVMTVNPPMDISEGRLPDGSTNIIFFSPQVLGLTASPERPNPLPSILRLDQPSGPQNFRLQFVLVSNLACTVQYQDQNFSVPWQDLTNFLAAPTNRTIEIIDPSPVAPSRLYRLRGD